MQEIAPKGIRRYKIERRKKMLVGAVNGRQKDSQESVEKKRRQRLLILQKPIGKIQRKQKQCE